jgi:hypothetical protein
MPERLYITALIPGQAARIQRSITSIQIIGLPTPWRTEKFEVAQQDPAHTAVQFSLPPDQTMPLLTRADNFRLTFELTQPYSPMELSASLATSRKNLIFAANHCSHSVQARRFYFASALLSIAAISSLFSGFVSGAGGLMA